ncbi:MAG TPA: L-histidine N(alpha)-methyltransferase [Candidatus Limnocylindria bacterium]|nr:L-histidine N(alpha)-methyltransferase [Candidatus Limnocylindria bacterium]
MKYFKNTELARIYKVSEKSVRNWIQATHEGKLELQLFEKEKRQYIANTTKNTLIIEQLVKKGKKYKNTRGYKVVSPSPKFYKLYNPRQVIDIISNLDNYRETPLQYSYFNSGAKRWDQYTHHLLGLKTPNSITSTIQLLELNRGYIDALIEGHKAVNIIDLGVGNALPTRGLLEHFLERGLLKRYVALDVSKEMLDIAERNVAQWFKGKVNFEGYVRDINYDRFDDLLLGETFGPEAGCTTNLVLFLGGTLSNFREPDHLLSTIRDSMGKRDLLLFTKKLDTEQSRRYFEMAVSGNQEIDLVIKLLNIDESHYTVEQFFDERNMARQVQIKLNVALAIKFQMDGKERIVEFNKGESILLWRAKHKNAVETIQQFDANGFSLVQAIRSKEQEYLLLISKIKTTQYS